MHEPAKHGEPNPEPAAFREALDDAIGQLPERYRWPLVLFHLQGYSLEQTSRHLRLNPKTASTRLGRARELLRRKLVRRGVAVGSVGALATLLSAESGAAVLPATFVASTVSAATGGSLTAAVATLTTKGITIMAMTKLKLGAVAAATALLLLGGGMLWFREPSAPPSVPPPETTTISPPKTVAATAPAVVTAATPAVSTGRALILRQANPPMEVTDSRGRRYVARNVTKLDGAVWRHYSAGMDPYFCGVFRVTEAEQIQIQQMLDAAWQGADALATCFEVSPTNDALVVCWKGDAFRDVYLAQRQSMTSQVLNSIRGILGPERAEVLGWLPQAGNIGWPDVLPDPARVSSDYRLTVSVTNANDVIAMRYQVLFGNGVSTTGQNPGLGPWPALGEQLGVPRQTILSNLAAQRQKLAERRFVQYRDPAEPVDNAPIAAEDTVTGQRYLYQPAPAR